jgi:hypothetical protein
MLALYNTGRFTSISNYDYKLFDTRESPKKEPDSPSEAKFKLAEKLYIPKLDKANNWYSREYVDELQKFYKKERETLKSRIENLTSSQEASRQALVSQSQIHKSSLSIKNLHSYKTKIFIL